MAGENTVTNDSDSTGRSCLEVSYAKCEATSDRAAPYNNVRPSECSSLSRLRCSPVLIDGITCLPSEDHEGCPPAFPELYDKEIENCDQQNQCLDSEETQTKPKMYVNSCFRQKKQQRETLNTKYEAVCDITVQPDLKTNTSSDIISPTGSHGILESPSSAKARLVSCGFKTDQNFVFEHGLNNGAFSDTDDDIDNCDIIAENAVTSDNTIITDRAKDLSSGNIIVTGDVNATVMDQNEAIVNPQPERGGKFNNYNDPEQLPTCPKSEPPDKVKGCELLNQMNNCKDSDVLEISDLKVLEVEESRVKNSVIVKPDKVMTSKDSDDQLHCQLQTHSEHAKSSDADASSGKHNSHVIYNDPSPSTIKVHCNHPSPAITNINSQGYKDKLYPTEKAFKTVRFKLHNVKDDQMISKISNDSDVEKGSGKECDNSRPKDHLLFALLVMCCCNLPIGMIAFAFSLLTTKLYETGEFQRARAYARVTLWLSLLGIGVTLLTVITVLVVYWPEQIKHD